MPSLASPWFHRSRSDIAQPVSRPKAPSTMSVDEQEALSARLSQPTESARYRRALFWKLDGYTEGGRHAWSKMELFEDCKRCMWTPSGSIKVTSCKIRPIKVMPNKPGPAPGV
ncbi:uncharacterized protein LOC143298564 [Babylonia areolata]|uniref:uncharacterized protein LOC143298564 n=1 Tax=Babylonia areolata TaxID=304850 RepID=UPI003FD45A9B